MSKTKDPRFSIEELLRQPPRCTVEIGGRVVQISKRRALIRDDSAQIWIEVEEGDLAPIGGWVVAYGHWTGSHLKGKIVLQNIGSRPFPNAKGEWNHFQTKGKLSRLHLRAKLLRAVRTFFESRDYLEIETPLMVPSPGLDLHLNAFSAGHERWLITSPEYQMKRILAGGASKIFQICRCFRADEQGAHHEPEFTMLEWYRSFIEPDELMVETESLVDFVAQTVRGDTKLFVGDQIVDVSPPWERLRVEEAFRRYANTNLDDVLPDQDTFFQIFVEQIEPHLGFPAPLFLTHWPASMASLARLHPQNNEICERFEAYIGGIELCNGFGELIDAKEQRARLERDRDARRSAGKPVYLLDERFLAALEEGLPVCCGNALGVDRLAMLILECSQIQDVMAFPSNRMQLC